MSCSARRETVAIPAIDESTDAYDTIDWLIKNVPNNNGKVGMPDPLSGWLTAMAMLDPHPALAAVATGLARRHVHRDAIHNGAFRLS